MRRPRVPWLVATSLLMLAGCSSKAPAPGSATIFEGAWLIIGDGSAPIENSAFIVENNQFTRVGRRDRVFERKPGLVDRMSLCEADQCGRYVLPPHIGDRPLSHDPIGSSSIPL